MPLIIFIAIIAAAIIWWAKGRQAATTNERLYLRRRGYDAGDVQPKGPPVPKEERLFSVLDSLSDISPSSRQRAAEEIAGLCDMGRGDHRMLAPLITALEDSNASVRGAVALALGTLGDNRAVEALERLARNDDSVYVHAAVLKALQRLKSQDGLGGKSA